MTRQGPTASHLIRRASGLLVPTYAGNQAEAESPISVADQARIDRAKAKRERRKARTGI